MVEKAQPDQIVMDRDKALAPLGPASRRPFLVKAFQRLRQGHAAGDTCRGGLGRFRVRRGQPFASGIARRDLPSVAFLETGECFKLGFGQRA